MNVQQAIIVMFMTGLLLVILSVTFTAFEEIMKDPSFIRYSLLCSIMVTWLLMIFAGDLYVITSKQNKELKSYKAQFHRELINKYTEALGSS